MYKVGQGILGKITFVDGTIPAYDRTYLIIKADNYDVSVLNVSSIRGKEHKLGFATNYRICNYNPPFNYPSFVKLDSLTTVSSDFIDNNCKLLHSGAVLSNTDIQQILNRLT